jgi:hypothetical protein
LVTDFVIDGLPAWELDPVLADFVATCLAAGAFAEDLTDFDAAPLEAGLDGTWDEAFLATADLAPTAFFFEDFASTTGVLPPWTLLEAEPFLGLFFAVFAFLDDDAGLDAIKFSSR